MDFTGRRAVVTGAASGIGRAVASMLCRHGATVWAVDRDADRLAEIDDGGAAGTLHMIAVDITAPDAPERIVAQAQEVDLLANVAGIMDHFLASSETDDATWDRVMAVNLTAPQRLMRAVLPGMIARGRGAIVNVASEAGLKGGCAGAAYTASKHGLVGLTKNSAFLYATRGVRINAVAPGPVETGMNPDFRSAIAAERLPAILQASIARVAQPDEIAATIAWLLDDQARAINGAILAADGGWSAA